MRWILIIRNNGILVELALCDSRADARQYKANRESLGFTVKLTDKRAN